MPGFINAHAHLQYGPSFADLAHTGHAFPEWLMGMTRRRQATTDEGWRVEVAASWELAYASGTVAVADIVTSDAALDVVVPGVRYLESVALTSEGWPDERDRLHKLLADHPEAGLSPHTLYTLGTDVLRGIIGMAREQSAPAAPASGRDRRRGRVRTPGPGAFRGLAFRRRTA